jgi:hypothetical protein
MPGKSSRPPGVLQDAELIPLGDLLTELSRAIGVIPAQAAIREAWLSGTVAFIGKKLVFANAKAALEVDLRFVVATEHVQIPPATLVRQELLGLTLNQLADSKRATLTTTGDLLDARGRLFVFALRSAAARRWPSIIAPPAPAIEPGAPVPKRVPKRRRKPAPKMPETRPDDLDPLPWAAARLVMQIDPEGITYTNRDELLAAVREHIGLSPRTLRKALAWLRERKLR